MGCDYRCFASDVAGAGHCGAESTGETPFVCTLPKRHRGPHVACSAHVDDEDALSPTHHNLDVWDDYDIGDSLERQDKFYRDNPPSLPQGGGVEEQYQLAAEQKRRLKSGGPG